MKKKDGNIYEISTWSTFLKLLFAQFRVHGIMYDYKTDFNSTGEFHSELMDELKAGSKTIEDYGTNKKKAKFDDDGDNKIRNAIMEKKLNPLENYYDMVKIMVFICGRYFLLRGGKEIASLRWEQFKFGTYEKGPDAGKSYVCLTLDTSKTYNKFKIDTVLKSKSELSYYVRDNPDDLVNPVEFIKTFRSYCPPEQENFFCCEQGEILKFSRFSNADKDGSIVPITYISSPKQRLGANMIGKQIKQLALISGWDDWKNCTNHGLRALGVTTTVNYKGNDLPNKAVLNHTRHANAKSQKP